ncbi:zinc ribbon domain-containing protein, partial [Mycobacterium ulcerans]
MPEVTSQQPAVAGWFTTDEAGSPHLIGSKCPPCGTYVFPPRENNCPNPACANDKLESVALSRRGKLWSYTENRYAPPPPDPGPPPL